MTIARELLDLAACLAGEFDNREQAIANPTWFVHLRLWHRPTALFATDSVTLFAEQVNVYTPTQPYRQRLLRLQAIDPAAGEFRVQFYSIRNVEAVRGGGQTPERLSALQVETTDRLPGCVLNVTRQSVSSGRDRFLAQPSPDTACYFSYQNQQRQVQLGFEATEQEFWSFDKGVDPDTGQALWGALMGPYQFQKRQAFAVR